MTHRSDKSFLYFLIYTILAFILSSLFLMFYVRIYPDKLNLLYILIPIAGVVCALLLYAPFKYLFDLEYHFKQEEEEHQEFH